MRRGKRSGSGRKADRIYAVNIERDRLPLEDGEADLIIVNQVLEHTKEVFWIFHQVFRSLKVGGHFLFGVPNICSFHNRFLLLMGRQPTQHKLCSAHVRPFSKKDTLAFLDACIPGGYELVKFRGAQFYPPPPGRLVRILADAYPTLAFSIFFMIRKTKEYNGEFATYPSSRPVGNELLVGWRKLAVQQRGSKHEIAGRDGLELFSPSVWWMG